MCSKVSTYVFYGWNMFNKAKYYKLVISRNVLEWLKNWTKEKYLDCTFKALMIKISELKYFTFWINYNTRLDSWDKTKLVSMSPIINIAVFLYWMNNL